MHRHILPTVLFLSLFAAPVARAAAPPDDRHVPTGDNLPANVVFRGYINAANVDAVLVADGGAEIAAILQQTAILTMRYYELSPNAALAAGAYTLTVNGNPRTVTVGAAADESGPAMASGLLLARLDLAEEGIPGPSYLRIAGVALGNDVSYVTIYRGDVNGPGELVDIVPRPGTADENGEFELVTTSPAVEEADLLYLVTYDAAGNAGPERPVAIQREDVVEDEEEDTTKKDQSGCNLGGASGLLFALAALLSLRRRRK